MRELRHALYALLLPAWLLAGTVASAALPTVDDKAGCQRITTAAGPYSLFLLPGSTRLLISTHDRRHFEKTGEIQEYDTASGQLHTLPRRGEPAGLQFRPHHLDMQQKNGETLLWIVNHDEDSPNSPQHSLLVYALQSDALKGDILVFRRRIRDALLSSPNHVSVAPDGDVYVSNDRRNGNSWLELALRQSKANVVHWREGEPWEVVADELAFPNGVKAESTRVLVALSFGNALLVYPRHADGKLGTPRKAFSLPALDGITPGPESGIYLLASHGPLLDFLRHKHDSRHPASGIIQALNPDTGSQQIVFNDDGQRISALTSAVMSGSSLYIGQAFDNFILRCPLH
ncbi:MAG: hypothetical protein REI12_05480 [Pedobacter sp.]|nr:hypothetical protein [Pedobacter sp.]